MAKTFPYTFGGQQVEASWGYVDSGRVAAQLTLPQGTYEFVTSSNGHCLSLAPSNPQSSSCTVMIKSKLGDDDLYASLLLDRPQYGWHIPQGVFVSIGVAGEVQLIDELIWAGRRDSYSSPNGRRPTFIERGSPLLKHLKPGDALKSEPIVNNGEYDYSIYAIGNPFVGANDRVFLDVELGDDVCYVDGNPMHIECLEGVGFAKITPLDEPGAETEIRDLRPGVETTIEAGNRVQFVATARRLLLYDETKDFNPTHEIPAAKYFATRGDLHGPAKASRPIIGR